MADKSLDELHRGIQDAQNIQNESSTQRRGEGPAVPILRNQLRRQSELSPDVNNMMSQLDRERGGIFGQSLRDDIRRQAQRIYEQALEDERSDKSLIDEYNKLAQELNSMFRSDAWEELNRRHIEQSGNVVTQEQVDELRSLLDRNRRGQNPQSTEPRRNLLSG